jgi:hypothetical protein
MADITAAAVMALRDKTGLPMMECKKALMECGGNTEQAVEWLRKQGIRRRPCGPIARCRRAGSPSTPISPRAWER